MKNIADLMNYYIRDMKVPAPKVFDALKEYIAEHGKSLYNEDMRKYFAKRFNDKKQ